MTKNYLLLLKQLNSGDNIAKKLLKFNVYMDYKHLEYFTMIKIFN